MRKSTLQAFPLKRLGLQIFLPAFAVISLAISGCNGSKNADSVTLLNASYDPTRELYRDLNQAFQKDYKTADGKSVVIRQSHGGSGPQARSLIDGLEADVATLAIWTDMDAISKAGLVSKDWETKFPNRALPYSSTIVFVVRKGNPKNVKDWPDLVKGDVQVITPSPKTSGNGKLSFLAAWGSVIKAGGTEDDALKYVTELYKRVPVLDIGARGATTTFAQREIGDVHLTWESEAYLEIQEAKGKLEIVVPKTSIQAEPHVAVVDKVVDKRGTRQVAEDYLNFLYTPEGQEIIAKHRYRPADSAVLEKHSSIFLPVELFGIEQVSPSWAEAQTRFFTEGGVFDKLYAGSRGR